ncbi:MAG: hotdog fold thioesterase [Cyclobacteriaceae bacterium]|nr:hotdog fold thioesterase [Cyclobacteriaceae bacterium]
MFSKDITIDKIQQLGDGCMVSHLGIKMIEIGDDYLKASMPVDHRTTQPFGILHGGASVVLAETLGSVASNLLINNKTHIAVGLDINANHLRPVNSGNTVIGIVKPLHLGRKTHVWEIKIHNTDQKLVCISRLTVSVIEK